MEHKNWIEIISSTKEQFKAIGGNSNTYLPNRLIMSLLQTTAKRLVKQATNVRKLMNSDNIFRTITVPMQNVSLSECCSFISPVQISRSINEIPRVAEGTYFNMLVQGIWSVDIVSNKFFECDPNRYANILRLDDVNPNNIYYWISNNYLYCSRPNLKELKFKAYFEEDIPDVYIDYPDYCGKAVAETCCGNEATSIGDLTKCCPPNPYDDESTIPGYLEDDVMTIVAKKLLTQFNIPALPTSGMPDSKK